VLDVDPPAGLDTLVEELSFPILVFNANRSHATRRTACALRDPGRQYQQHQRRQGPRHRPQPRLARPWRLCRAADTRQRLSLGRTLWARLAARTRPNSAVAAGRSDRPRCAAAPQPVDGLDPYAEAALDGACRAIIGAPNGEQESTLNGECFSIGTLAGAGCIPADFARDTLHWAARQIVSYDPKRKWSDKTLRNKVDSAFDAGRRQPRGRRRA
jgi:hypothetical protein